MKGIKTGASFEAGDDALAKTFLDVISISNFRLINERA